MNMLVQQSALRKPLAARGPDRHRGVPRSEDSELMTGQVIVVDGGMVMLG